MSLMQVLSWRATIMYAVASALPQTEHSFLYVFSTHAKYTTKQFSSVIFLFLKSSLQ